MVPIGGRQSGFKVGLQRRQMTGGGRGGGERRMGSQIRVFFGEWEDVVLVLVVAVVRGIAIHYVHVCTLCATLHCVCTLCATLHCVCTLCATLHCVCTLCTLMCTTLHYYIYFFLETEHLPPPDERVGCHF